MKITKRQLRRIIKEEKQKLLNEAPHDRESYYEWKVEYYDGRVFRTSIDEDNLNQEMEVEIDPAKLSAALENGDFDKPKKKGPSAGSMPWSKSPVNPKSPNFGKHDLEEY